MSGAQSLLPPLPPVPLLLLLLPLLLLVVDDPPPPEPPPLLDPEETLDELVSAASSRERFSQSWLQALNTMADEQAIPTIKREGFNIDAR